LEKDTGSRKKEKQRKNKVRVSRDGFGTSLLDLGERKDKSMKKREVLEGQ